MSQPLATVVAVAVLSGVAGGLLSRALWPQRHVPRPHDDGTPQTTTAKSFVLIDEANRQRGLLRVINEDVLLLLTDLAMRWAIRISVGNEGPYMYFSEKEIPSRVGLGILPNGDAAIELAEPSGKGRGFFRLGADGTCALLLNDSEGRTRVSLQVSAGGDPSLTLLDAAGNALTRLP